MVDQFTEKPMHVRPPPTCRYANEDLAGWRHASIYAGHEANGKTAIWEGKRNFFSFGLFLYGSEFDPN